MKHLLQLLLTLVIGVGGAFAPPMALAADHLLFASGMETAHAWVYRMDGAGYLTPVAQPTASEASLDIAVSPDGHTVVYSGYSTPTLTVFHLRPDGALTPPVYVNGLAEVFTNPVVFHPSLPLFYVTTQSGTSTYKYDWATSTVQALGGCKQIGACPNAGFGYSPWCGRLVYSDYVSRPYDALNTCPLNTDGTLGTSGPKYVLPHWHSSFALSPDGRWVAVLEGHVPERLMMVSVGRDGALQLTQTVTFIDDPRTEADDSLYMPDIGPDNFPVFSPNGRFFFLLSNGLKILVCYALDSETGQLTELSHIGVQDLQCAVMIPDDLALTPDGHYAVFRTAHPTRWSEGHNMIHVVRLSGDGEMEYLADHQVDVPEYIGDMAFAPLPHNAAGPQWALYE